MSDCIFCKIINKDIPSEFVYEDNDVVVINDINPQAPVHMLVLPKKHVESLNELEDKNLMGALISGVKNVVKKLGITDYRSVINTGKKAGQEVFHLHIHVFAGREMKWPPC